MADDKKTKVLKLAEMVKMKAEYLLDQKQKRKPIVIHLLDGHREE